MLLTCVLVTAAGLCAAPQDVPVSLPAGPHPCVFLTAEEAQAVRARARSVGWAREVAEGIAAQADAQAARELDIPHKGGQWSHWYTCKKDGGRLKTESPTEHVCSVCGEVYTGWPYDQVAVTYRHGFWLGAIETLGAAYMLTGNEEYAARGRGILLEYASFYESIELHNVHGKKSASAARLYAQTLDEACSLCRVCAGYDLMFDAACFSEDDHAAIAAGLLRPMVETIRRNKAGRSNWQSWHNAAIASVGFLLRDEGMVHFAINDPKNGFLYQMRDSVFPSGMWYEGAPSYHWYALSAHVYLLEAAERAGMDLYAMPIVKAMFDAPVRQLFPDKTFPAVNDSNRSPISSARRFYSVAYRRFGDPNHRALMMPRDSLWALLWGTDEDASGEAPELALETSNDADEGLAILRDGEGSALFLNYSRQAGGHTHPAKLDIILFALGDERIVDPGRLPYGNPIHRQWYTQTLAHNTVVVNQTCQKHAACELVLFEHTGNGAVVRARCDEAYDGVHLERTLLQQGSIFVDVFDCEAGDEVMFELPLHFRAELAGLPDGEPLEPPEDKPGYMHLKEYRVLEEAPPSFSADCGDAGRIVVHVLDDSRWFTAKGFGASPRELLPMVIRRQEGTRARFMAVYEVVPEGEQAAAEVRMDGADAVVVVPGGGEPHLRFNIGDGLLESSAAGFQAGSSHGTG